jgi:anti-sigma B factor antagonist
VTETVCPRVFVESIDGVTVASFADAELVSEEVIGAVDEQLTDLARGLTAGDVLLNFREVRLMSSTMLAVLLMFSRKVAAVGGKVKLCCLDPSLVEIFKITRFDRLFEIHADEFVALDSF